VSRADANEREFFVEAAQWWLHLRDPASSEEDTVAWLAWCGADARHAQAFASVAELGGEIISLDEVSRRSLIAEFALQAPRPRAQWHPRWLTASAILIAVVLAGDVTRFATVAVVEEKYTSKLAENRDIALPDGSQVMLGGKSTFTIRFSAGQRSSELETGEAFFEVAHDAKRPWVVAAGKIAVRAVGTAFDVRRSGERVTIVVTEGRVRIGNCDTIQRNSAGAALEAVAGQRVTYDPATAGFLVASVTPQRPDWHDRAYLEFFDEPLESVVATINRYSRRPLHLADADLAALPYTGTVRLDSLDGWVHGLAHAYPLRVAETADRITLSSVKSRQ
jgi:transmembrane sensor